MVKQCGFIKVCIPVYQAHFEVAQGFLGAETVKERDSQGIDNFVANLSWIFTINQLRE
jgi:hypothetical protein